MTTTTMGNITMKLTEAIQLYESSNTLEVYHGDNYNTTRLDPRLMNNGNNQEGIGIYFSDNPVTARKYGSNVIRCTINLNNIAQSRGDTSAIGMSAIKKIMMDMARVNKEEAFLTTECS